MARFQTSSATASAGTAIFKLIRGADGLITTINNIIYTSGSTAHTITILRPVAATTAAGGTNGGESVITFADLGAMKITNSSSIELAATNDYIAWINTNGQYAYDTIGSVSGNEVTTTNSIGTAIDGGAPVWIFGELARTTHVTLSPPVSATTSMDVQVQAGQPGQINTNVRVGDGDPVIVTSNNATAAGTIVSISGTYVDPGDVALH